MSKKQFPKWESSTGYQITTDPNKIDTEKLHHYLSKEAYWSKGISKELVLNSLKYSLNFSILSPNFEFIGFARVVTDYSTFGWLADVFVNENHRRKGLGKWLIKTILEHPDLQTLRNFLLFTIDAHGLYQKYGWNYLENPEILLAKKKPVEEIYKT
jgi:hypothetical protein